MKNGLSRLKKKGLKLEAKITKADDGTNSNSQVFLSILLKFATQKCLEMILSAAYHVCPKRELFANFEKLDGGLVPY